MGKLSKELAIKVSKLYATDAINSRSDITNKSNYPMFNLTSKDISRCIYFCIFFDLITKTEELIIVKKLNENMKRYSPKIGDVSKKYLETLYDKRVLLSYEERIKNFEQLMSIITSLEDNISQLNHELDFVNNLNLDDFLCSDDEISYNPPRTKSEIEQDLAGVSEYLNSILKNHSKDALMNNLEHFKNLKEEIIKKYSI